VNAIRLGCYALKRPLWAAAICAIWAVLPLLADAAVPIRRQVHTGHPASVYQVVLKQVVYPSGQPKAIVVQDRPISVRLVGGWPPKAEDIPAALRSRAEALKGAADDIRFDPTLFPAGTHLVPKPDLDKWDREATVRGSEYFFKMLREHYPGFHSMVYFSRAIYTGEALDALVYYEILYGVGGCGELVWLQRRSTSDEWSVRLVLIKWLS
jgi:hypothetical protein